MDNHTWLRLGHDPFLALVRSLTYSWVTLHKTDLNAAALQHSAHSFWVREIFSTWKERLCSLCSQATVLCVCVCSAGTPGTVSSFSQGWLCNSCPSAFCSHTGPPRSKHGSFTSFNGVAHLATNFLTSRLLLWPSQGMCGSNPIMPNQNQLRKSSSATSCMEYNLFF